MHKILLYERTNSNRIWECQWNTSAEYRSICMEAETFNDTKVSVGGIYLVDANSPICGTCTSKNCDKIGFLKDTKLCFLQSSFAPLIGRPCKKIWPLNCQIRSVNAPGREAYPDTVSFLPNPWACGHVSPERNSLPMPTHDLSSAWKQTSILSHSFFL